MCQLTGYLIEKFDGSSGLTDIIKLKKKKENILNNVCV